MVTTPAPEPAEGEALLRTTYVGIDAAARTWLDDQPSYLPPVQLGEVIRAAGIGEVVASRCDAYAVGDVVTTLTGFQEYALIRDDLFSTPIPGEDDQLAIMSVYGPTGATAYFGMTDIGRPQPGETVVVSARGRHRIGRRADRQDRRRPGGGYRRRPGEMPGGGGGLRVRRVHRLQERRHRGGAEKALPATRRRLLRQCRRAHPQRRAGPAGLPRARRPVRCHLQLPHRRAPRPGQLREPAVEDRADAGFNALDEWGRFDEAFAALRQWEAEGRLHHRQTIFEGIESCVDALNGLFTGVNVGKTLVRLSEPSRRRGEPS